MKKLYLDLETTGVDPNVNHITQIAAIFEDEDGGLEMFDTLVIPPTFPGDYEDNAAVVTGLTIEKLNAEGTPYATAYNMFLEFLGGKINKFDKTDKAIVIGYNVKFDINFMWEFFKYHNDNYFGSWAFSCQICIMTKVAECLEMELIPLLPNYKLETVAKEFGITFEAHNAAADIEATRDLHRKIQECIENKIVMDYS